MAPSTCRRERWTKARRVEVQDAILSVLQKSFRPLYASEIAQKVYEATAKTQSPLCVSDDLARKQLRALAQHDLVVEHTNVAYVPAARGRRALSTYSAKN
jgi:hypothetical protein